MEASDLPARAGGYPARLPERLQELSGPATGRVELPRHIAWSGKRAYDLSDSAQHLPLYALLLAEAPRVDLVRLVNADLLLAMWPRLRPLLGPAQRAAWDTLLPEQ